MINPKIWGEESVCIYSSAITSAAAPRTTKKQILGPQSCINNTVAALADVLYIGMGQPLKIAVDTDNLQLGLTMSSNYILAISTINILHHTARLNLSSQHVQRTYILDAKTDFWIFAQSS